MDIQESTDDQLRSQISSTVEDNIDLYLENQEIDFNNYNNIQINAIQTSIQNNLQQEKNSKDLTFKDKFGTEYSLEQKILRQFCNMEQNLDNNNDNNVKQQQQNIDQNQLLQAYLLVQVAQFIGQMSQQKQQNYIFQQYPQLKAIKDVLSTYLQQQQQQQNYQEIQKEHVKSQNQEKSDNSIIQQETEKSKSKFNSNEILKKEFQQYKEDFKNEAIKKEVLNYQNKNNDPQQSEKQKLFEKAIFHRRLSKIFYQMGKMQKSFENQFLALQSFVKGSKKTYDPTTIYWLYEMTQISKQLDRKSQQNISPLIFSHIVISYQDILDKNKGGKQFSLQQKNQDENNDNNNNNNDNQNLKNNLQGICLYYLGKSCEILQQYEYAVQIYSKCINGYFSENLEIKTQILRDISQTFLAMNDYENYQYFSQELISQSESIFEENHPQNLFNFQLFCKMENKVKIDLKDENFEDEENQENEDDDQENIFILRKLQIFEKSCQDSFIQSLLFSDILFENGLYENCLKFKQTALNKSNSKLEIAYINQEMGEVYFAQKEFQKSLQQYDRTLNCWNLYFSLQIEKLKQKNEDYSYLGKMMEIKRAQIRSIQIPILEKLQNYEQANSNRQKVQKIMVQVLGHYDILALDSVVNKIDEKCKNIFTREIYLQNTINGAQNYLWIDSEMVENIKPEVLQGLVTIFNRFYMKYLYKCISQQNMQNMLKMKFGKQNLQKPSKVIQDNKIQNQENWIQIQNEQKCC